MFRETLGHYHIRCDVLHGAEGHVGARVLHAHLDELLPHIKPRPRDLSSCIGVFVLRMSSGAVSNSGLLVFAGRLISLTPHTQHTDTHHVLHQAVLFVNMCLRAFQGERLVGKQSQVDQKRNPRKCLLSISYYSLVIFPIARWVGFWFACAHVPTARLC